MATGGSINVKSQEGVGTDFIINLVTTSRFTDEDMDTALLKQKMGTPSRGG